MHRLIQVSGRLPPFSFRGRGYDESGRGPRYGSPEGGRWSQRQSRSRALDRRPGDEAAARGMEEKEQLKRQIRLLQGLINDHKNVHGDVPVPPPAPTSRWRNPRPPAFNTHGAFSARYAQQTQRDFPACPSSANAWRKKYSLVNVPPRLTLSSGSNVPACTSRILPSHTVAEVAESQPMISGRNVGFRVAAGPAVSHAAGPAVSHTAGPVLAFRGHRTSTAGLAKSGSKESKESCASTLPDVLHCRTSSRNDAPAMCGMGIVAAKGGQGASKVAPDLCRTTSESAVALKSEPQQPLTLPNHESDYLSARKKPASNLPTLYSSQQVASVMDKPNSSRAADASLACANSAWEASSAVETTLLKNENSVPVLQRSPASPASVKSLRFRRTNYTWVANSCKSLRTVKRYATSRAPENARKFSAGVEPVSRLHPRGDLGTKQKKSSLHSKLGISSSQYKWKAFSLQPSPSTSAFTWQRKECGGAAFPLPVGASSSLQPVRRGPLGHGNPKSFSGNTSFLNYKLKSRTKIIKRKGSFCSPSDKRSTAAPAMLLKSRYCLRKRNSPRGRTSPAAKRAGAKGLVQIGKHRLRRLPASRSAKEVLQSVTCQFPRMHTRTCWCSVPSLTIVVCGVCVQCERAGSVLFVFSLARRAAARGGTPPPRRLRPPGPGRQWREAAFDLTPLAVGELRLQVVEPFEVGGLENGCSPLPLDPLA
ncbi:zinc finger CCCH domain-containing protein 3-like [Varanus komodoensis]|uniref:zinc finger CCCH domain-containing protein 3-like n=1 Tax=Varanus komodoensis TaxID=61221 RepID=UPI001CF7A877|nr:zinc finger CCCH domain-containing protein 3-like [Varanus komodoensis]